MDSSKNTSLERPSVCEIGIQTDLDSYALRATENLVCVTFRDSSIPSAIISRDRFLEVNSALCALLGYEKH